MKRERYDFRQALLGVSLALLCSSNFGCSADPSSDARSDEPALDGFIENVAAGLGMPGVQTAAIKNGRVVWAKSYGLAVTSPLPERPMSNDTILEIGGISQGVIAVAFMQRVDAGTLGLDDDINHALPWPVRNPHFPDVPITWRMVLTKSASFTDDARAYVDPVVFGMDSATPLADILRDVYTPGGRYYTDATFSAVRPGKVFAGGAFGVLLAAYAIELDVLQPFHEYVQEHIFQPLGMEATSYFLRDLPEDRLAVGYTCDPLGSGFACLPPGDPNGTLLDQQHSFPQYPLALVRTSATQYLKFIAMLMNDGQVGSSTILSKASVDQLFEPSPIRALNGLEQGIIFLSLGDQGLWGNVGGDLGVAASVYFDRDSGVGAIAIGNSEDSAKNGAIFGTHYNQMTQIVSKLVSEFR